MEALDPQALETDPRFPSGAWTGFFMQRMLPGRRTMTLNMTFRDGRLEACGSDIVGPFSFSGSYDPQDSTCRWTKQYFGKHQVTYSGVNEGEGIWGVWEIRALGGWYRDRGVFHIWPQGMTPSREADLTALAFTDDSGGPAWMKWAVAGLAVAVGYLLCWYFEYL
jgi:hypothetical protein